MNTYLTDISHRVGVPTRLSTELETPSPIFFGYEIANRFPAAFDEICAADSVDKLFLVTDARLHSLYGQAFYETLLQTRPEAQLMVLPVGEFAKSFQHLETLCQELIARGASKRSVIVALGGGSIGNLVGLAAGLLFRGIRYVEVPTSFTHQTDGTLSNKQAINGATGKNQFGMYHAPAFIWADTKYLLTEPPHLKKAGIVEGVKNALIDQVDLVPYLQIGLRPQCDYSAQEVTDLAYKIILSKLQVLKQDPTEKGYGLVLEYGHTFAHAVEWLAAGRLIHGECVALGMKMAAHLAERLGMLSRGVVDLHYELIDQRLGLLPYPPREIDTAAMLAAMHKDNKKTGAGLRYVLLEQLGRCANPEGDYLVAVDDGIVTEVLDAFLGSYRLGACKVNEASMR